MPLYDRPLPEVSVENRTINTRDIVNERFSLKFTIYLVLMVRFSKFKVHQKPMKSGFLWQYRVCVLIRPGVLKRSNTVCVYLVEFMLPIQGASPSKQHQN